MRLLDRTTRRLSVTEAGTRFYRRCTRVLEEVADARDEASASQITPRGTLRVSAPLSFAITRLGRLIPDYLRRYPDVSIDIDLNDRVVDLIEEQYDVAIRIGELADSSLIARRLAPCPHLLCASPDYLAEHGMPGHPEQLADHRCVEYAYRGGAGEWHLDGPNGQQTVRIRPRLKANNGLLLRSALVAGYGIGLSPQFIVDDDLKAGRLVPVMQDYAPPATAIYAVYPARRYLAPKVLSFIDFLADNL